MADNNYIKDTVIVGLDPIDIYFFINRKSKKYQAVLLHDIEEILGKNSEEFPQIRKLVLDSYGNYTRSIQRIVFGDDFE